MTSLYILYQKFATTSVITIPHPSFRFEFESLTKTRQSHSFRQTMSHFAIEQDENQWYIHSVSSHPRFFFFKPSELIIPIENFMSPLMLLQQIAFM